MKIYFDNNFSGFLTYKTNEYYIEKEVNNINDGMKMIKHIELPIEQLRSDYINQIKDIYRKKFSETDEIIMKYIKREKLGILTDDDISDYDLALKKYYELLSKYREIKNKIISINNIDTLTKYFKDILQEEII